MKKILILLPENNIGKQIMNGFCEGFKLNNCKVLKKELNNSDYEVKFFKPDIILSYNYSLLESENSVQIMKSLNCKNFAFYFTDNPKSEKLLYGKNYLYDKLLKLNPKIFISNKTSIKEFKNSIYMPLAVDYLKYQTEFSGYKYFISFIGSPLADNVQKILCELIKVFKNKVNIFASEKDFLQSIKEIKQKKLLDDNYLKIYSNCRQDLIEKEKDLAKIYNSSKINLNINSDEETPINYKILEILASGGFLLTNEQKKLKNYFQISKHLETYKNAPDLIDKINFYLNNLNITQKIALLGRLEVIKKYNFNARAGKILQNI
jgi:hypothetical protein